MVPKAQHMFQPFVDIALRPILEEGPVSCPAQKCVGLLVQQSLLDELDEMQRQGRSSCAAKVVTVL